MPLPKQLTFPPKIPFLKPILGTLALLLVAAFVAPMFVSTQAIQTKLVDSLSKTTGMSVKATVKGSVSAFPSPHVALADITIGDEKPLLVARAGQLNLGWAGLFSGALTPDMVLTTPIINISESDTDIQTTVKQLCAAPGKLTLQNADITVNKPSSDTSVRIQGANGTLSCNAQGLTLALQGKAFGQDGSLEIKSGLESSQPFNIVIASNGNRAEFTGTLPAQGAESTGTLALHINHISTLLPKAEEAKAPEQQIALIDLKGDATLGASELWLHRTDATINGAKGQLAAYASIKTLPTLAVDLRADAFDVNPLTPLVSTLLKSATPAAESPETVKEDRHLILLANITEATLGARKLKDVQANMEYSGLDIPLRDISATMEDGSIFTFNGRYTARSLGARIEGKASLEGKSFKNFLTTFEQAAAGLPDEDFGIYSLNGNMFWSNEQFRISEAEVKLGEIGFTGGLSTYFEKTTRTEAEIRLKDVNLDYFRNTWRKAKQTDSKPTYQFALLSDGQFGWLKSLSGVVDLNLWFDGFTFLDRAGKIGNVHIIAKPGELALSGMELALPEGSLRSNITLNVQGERPRLGLIISMPFYDSSYTKTDDDMVRPWIIPDSKDKRFSEEVFDFSWVSALDADFDINVISLKWNDKDYGFFKTSGALKNQQIQFQNFALNMFGGQLSANGTLTGGKVPAISAAFALYNTHVEEVLPLFSLPPLVGRANISGTITTSGLHFLEWIKQADVRSSITARGVRMPGFNLQGILDTTQAARNTDDVVKGVAQMMQNGTTEFSVDGSLNLDKGTFKTPGLTLSSGTQTTGVLGGQADLLTWRMNMDAKFQFPQLGAITTPTFGINIAGPLEAYTIRTDTASLEAYVAKRIVGQ